MSQARVGVVVVTYNRWYDTERCLASLQVQEEANYHVVVVDNGSSDGTPAAVRQAYPDVELIVNPDNQGWSKANNIGIEHCLAHGDTYVFLLNNDTYLAPDCLAQLLQVAESDPKIGLVGAKVLFYDQPARIQYARTGANLMLGRWQVYGRGEVDHGQYDAVSDIGFVSGCAMLLRGSLYRQLGPIDEDYFCLYEDLDYNVRAQQAGARVVLAPAARVWHRLSVSFGGTLSPDYLYYETRNRLLFMRKHARYHRWLFFPWVFLFALLARLQRLARQEHLHRVYVMAIFAGLSDYVKGHFGGRSIAGAQEKR